MTERASKRIRELAEKLYEAMDEAYLDGTAAETIKAAERILSAELRPLLEAVELVCDVHGEKHPTSCVHHLAELLEHWR